MNRNDAIDFARAHALHHGRAGDHAYLPSTLEQAAEFLPHAWVVDALCEAVETRIVDDEAVLKLALDRGYTPTDDFGDEELLSFARELRTVLTTWSLSEEPTGEPATCTKCGYLVCHDDCGAEDYEVQKPGFQARYRLPGGEWSSWGHVVCGVKGHEMELREVGGDASRHIVCVCPDCCYKEREIDRLRQELRIKSEERDCCSEDIQRLRAAVIGILEIETERIKTGGFKPNPEAQRRIDAAWAAL